ncbi:isochorismatase family protein [Amycolatopsis sp. SID8362]|uniref:isochorismatase family protein n=1 Tax=Amycolatopsis sp. SID8362 TaxID=2690346 RepID=UPI00136D6482|nr:isochorismatase family protein [Amycolatopsis sp. SID8362]NBH02930.1 isochorismatase family protein [Amycolatopsis sp. SID8362]NED39631.1 isochorismatase family protein [Amycolatopsis sp. SID8362]
MTKIDPATSALVLVDLQERIVALPTTPHRGEDVVRNALRLRDAFREAGAPVVIVQVSRPDNPPGNELVFDAQDDKIVTKYTIGGFADTDLDEYLRGKGVRTVYFGGIATEFGVESTLRAASDHGYDTVAVSDAMTALSEISHENAITKIFPRLGTVVTTDEVLA